MEVGSCDYSGATMRVAAVASDFLPRLMCTKLLLLTRRDERMIDSLTTEAIDATQSKSPPCCLWTKSFL
jgi:hypothetical protein